MKPIRAVPEPWLILIDRYAAALRVKGHPETTIGTQRQHLQFLARRIGHPPSEVTHGILVEWCSQQKWARESRRGRQNTFRYFWRWAKKHAGLKNVAKKLPKVKAIPGTARPAPEGVYLRALIKSDARTRLILRLAGECGLRRGEIALTNSHDLIDDLIGWSIYVHGKGGKTRIVPLPNGLARELLALPSGWMFPGQINGHLSPAESENSQQTCSRKNGHSTRSGTASQQDHGRSTAIYSACKNYSDTQAPQPREATSSKT